MNLWVLTIPLVNSLFTLRLLAGMTVNDTTLTLGTTVANLGMTDNGAHEKEDGMTLDDLAGLTICRVAVIQYYPEILCKLHSAH